MSRPAADAHRARLAGLAPDELEADLLAHSGLPGPRANLELLAVAVEVAPLDRLVAWAGLDATAAPTGSQREYLAVCGVTAFGRRLREASRDARPALLEALADHARDRRWRIRESVAMALQSFGAVHPRELVTALDPWARRDDRLVQRAVVAGLCEPALLRDPGTEAETLRLLAVITASIRGAGDRRTEAFRVLRQALAYGWSVAVAAAPERGRPAFERWLDEPDPDVTWVMRQNLGKARLRRLDPAWVERSLGRLAASTASAGGSAS